MPQQPVIYDLLILLVKHPVRFADTLYPPF